MKIYYMRDNHTFLPIPLDPDEAEMLLRQEFDNGYTFGMLCSKHEDSPGILHAGGNAELESFITNARVWIEEARRRTGQ